MKNFYVSRSSIGSFCLAFQKAAVNPKDLQGCQILSVYGKTFRRDPSWAHDQYCEESRKYMDQLLEDALALRQQIPLEPMPAKPTLEKIDGRSEMHSAERRALAPKPATSRNFVVMSILPHPDVRIDLEFYERAAGVFCSGDRETPSRNHHRHNWYHIGSSPNMALRQGRFQDYLDIKVQEYEQNLPGYLNQPAP